MFWGQVMNIDQMAHEFAMKLVGNPNTPLKDINSIVCASWSYVDAMQAESDKRKPKGLPEVLFEPDWSQAPDNMTHFAVDANGSGWFFNREPHAESDCCWYCGDDSTELNNHNYQGNWQDSLRKRP